MELTLCIHGPYWVLLPPDSLHLFWLAATQAIRAGQYYKWHTDDPDREQPLFSFVLLPSC